MLYVAFSHVFFPYFTSFLSSASSSSWFLLSLSSLSTAVSSEFFDVVIHLCAVRTICCLELYVLWILFTSFLVVLSCSTHTSACNFGAANTHTHSHTYVLRFATTITTTPLRRSCQFVGHVVCFHKYYS